MGRGKQKQKSQLYQEFERNCKKGSKVITSVRMHGLLMMYLDAMLAKANLADKKQVTLEMPQNKLTRKMLRDIDKENYMVLVRYILFTFAFSFLISVILIKVIIKQRRKIVC